MRWLQTRTELGKVAVEKGGKLGEEEKSKAGLKGKVLVPLPGLAVLFICTPLR